MIKHDKYHVFCQIKTVFLLKLKTQIMTGKQLDLFQGYNPQVPTKEHRIEVFKEIAEFQSKMFEKPDPAFVEKTPDGKANTLVISHIETRLDEIYSGLWSATNFRFQQIGNEIVGTITLKVFNPACGVWIEREGAAAIVIMTDRAPSDLQGRDKNLWALDMQNKKPNALYMGFPKLKAECIKNAAKSLGDTFGRSLNRKKTDSTFEPDVNRDEDSEIKAEILKSLGTCTLPDATKDGIKKLLSGNVMYSRLIGIRDSVKLNQPK
jgi:hypothetical protein